MGGIHRLGMGGRNGIADSRPTPNFVGRWYIRQGWKKDTVLVLPKQTLVATTGMVSIMLIVAFY
jgi:hypothetical protein